MEPKKSTQSQVKNQTKLSGEDALLHPVDSDVELEDTMKFNTHIIISVYVVVIVLGVLTGYLLSKSPAVGSVSKTVNSNATGSDNAVGSTDTTTFKDTATGVIEKGGLNGEGTHKLIRDGGPSQTAYLTSSIVDLDEYIGKKVTIWGQTMTAKKVSWLMDVGKLETISE